MKTSHIIFRSFLHAFSLALYVSLVALLLSNGEQLFGSVDSFLIPVFMLLLFVLSATVSALLVLGLPAALYFSGSRRTAIIVLGATLGWLAVFICGIALVMATQWR
ncbi:MAG: hypothetical protein WC052_01240 [Patescibacteria group bacterium]